MSHVFFLLILFFFAFPLHAKIEWHTDYQKVQSISQQENKPLLLFFNGSDWAGSAMKLKHEILSSSAFQDKIGEKLICMEVDFPKHAHTTETNLAQNESLKKRFKIQDPPSILLIDASERVIAQIGYLPEDGEQFAAELLKILEQDKELVLNLKNVSTSSSFQLKKLYQLAQELSNDSALEQILEVGVRREDPFFYLEKYRLLVEKGEMRSQEALSLRQKLSSFGTENEIVNGEFIPFTLALIDFQELVSRNQEPELAAQPLIEYLVHFGKIDHKNIWRIEMMIAEIYLDADQWEEALKHAEKAYEAAPEPMHEEIAHSLDYIRSQNPAR